MHQPAALSTRTEEAPASLPPETVRGDTPTRFARVAAGVVGVVARLAPGAVDLRLATILDTARARTGLRDWGTDHFLEPMERLLREADEDVALTALGRLILGQVAVTAVTNRLSIQAYVARHPEVRSIPIERPLFVVGFPRSGTTLLQNLLALHPDHRALHFWELLTVTPTHRIAAWDRQVRRARAALMIGLAYRMTPEQRVVHAIGVDTAEECWPLFQTSASALNNDLMSGFTRYGDWLLTHDMAPAYADYRLQLQVLSHRQPRRRFVLKCPEHLWFLDSLLDIFPDAHVLWTHRAPVDCVASYCSMASLQARNLRETVDRPRLGVHLSRRFVEGVERAMAVRFQRRSARFMDVRYTQLTADPVGTVRAISAWAEARTSPEDEARLTAWLQHEPSHGPGRHHYRAESFELDVEGLHRRFAPYIQRYLGLGV